MVHIKGITKVQKSFRKISPMTRFPVQSTLTTLSSHASLLRGWGEMTWVHFPEVRVCFRVFHRNVLAASSPRWPRLTDMQKTVRWTRWKKAKTFRCPTNVFILTYTFTCVRTNYIVNVCICGVGLVGKSDGTFPGSFKPESMWILCIYFYLPDVLTGLILV